MLSSWLVWLLMQVCIVNLSTTQPILQQWPTGFMVHASNKFLKLNIEPSINEKKVISVLVWYLTRTFVNHDDDPLCSFMIHVCFALLILPLMIKHKFQNESVMHQAMCIRWSPCIMQLTRNCPNISLQGLGNSLTAEVALLTYIMFYMFTIAIRHLKYSWWLQSYIYTCECLFSCWWDAWLTNDTDVQSLEFVLPITLKPYS